MKLPVSPPTIQVPGFRFAGVCAGIKESGRRDVAVIFSDRPAAAVGVFTTNRVQAAPVQIGRQRVAAGKLQAIVVNSGNANAFTGAAGLAAAREMTAVVAREMRIPERLVVPSSTGRIGVQLPRAKLRRGVRAACRALDYGGFASAHEAIMTTDAFPKYAFAKAIVDGRAVTVAAMGKGAGMIAPRMATMLIYILTDAAASRAALRAALREHLPESLNAIVVDGDMSTNDTVLLLANGVAGNRPLSPRSRDFPDFSRAVGAVMRTLARMVVKDGEGATKVIEIRVRGARTRKDAERVADAIARSPLCKTAFHGGDPYAGRIVCAAGYSGAVFDPDRLDAFLDDVQIVRSGVQIVRRVEGRAARVAGQDEFTLTIDLHAGKAAAMRLTSDLTPAYVKFNSDYRT